MADDLIKILRILRLDFDEDAIRNEPRANVSPTSLRITWDRSLRDEVEALERAGIVRYGYAQ